MARLFSCVLLFVMFVNSALGDSRIDRVLQRGSLRCASKNDNKYFGLGPPNANNFTGLDPDVCRAIAVAIFANVTADTIDAVTDFELTTTTTRFIDLANGRYDLLLRTTTVTITRESLGGLVFTTPYFFDSQGMIALNSSGLRTPADVDRPGIQYCVVSGSTSLANAQARFSFAQPLICANDAACFARLAAGDCQFQTGDKSSLAAQQATAANPAAYIIVPETGWTREPFGVGVLDPCGATCTNTSVSDGDLDFNELANWVVHGLFLSEIYGIDEDAAALPDLPNLHPEARALLGYHPVTLEPMNVSAAEMMGLPPQITWDFMGRVVRLLGNYGNLFRRNTLEFIGRSGPNRLYTNSGAQYPGLWLPATPSSTTPVTYETFTETAGGAARSLKCGVKRDAISPAADVFSLEVGFDLDFCRALAATVFSSSPDWNPVIVDSFITQVDYNASDAVDRLLGGEIDALVGWPISIGADMQQGLTFSPPIFFDNMAVMVPTADSLRSLTINDVSASMVEINQAWVRVCVRAKSVFATMAQARWPNAQIIPVERDSDVVSWLAADDCDVGVNGEAYLTLHWGRLNLGSSLTFVSDTDGVPISLVRVPYGIATRDNDMMWGKIIRWLVFGLNLAEEYQAYGVDLENVLSLQQLGCTTACPPEVQRLLWLTNFDHGLHGPELDFMVQVIATVGHYGEIYSRNWEQGLLSDYPRDTNPANYQWNDAAVTGAHYPLAWNIAGGTTVPTSPLSTLESDALLALRTSLAVPTNLWNALPNCAWAYLSCISPAGPVERISASGKLQLPANRSLPAAIFGLRGLAELDLSDVDLAGPLPRELSALVSLSVLRLSNNRLNGTVPNLQNMTDLSILELGGNLLTGSLPDFSPSMTSLSAIDLSFNDFDGPLLFLRNPFNKMINLTLSHNRLGNGTTLSRLPSQISNLPNLVDLRLDHNALDGSLPRGLWSLKYLEYLDLSFNSFSGTITPDISRLTSIKHINLEHNALNSSLPPTFVGLTTLVHLDVSHNGLSGTVPLSGQMGQLSFLDVSHNQLTNFSFVNSTGLVGLGALTYLDLSNNRFGGRLPELPRTVRYLDLSNNDFSGPIPESWAELQLERVYLSGNRLTGRVPRYFESLAVCDLGSASFECSETQRCAGSVPMCAAEVSGNADDSRNTIIIAVVVPVGVLIIAVIVVVLVLLLRPRQAFSMDFITWSQNAQVTDIIINERLGGGLFGDVYKGLWNGHTAVALKKLKEKENPEEFENEALILAQLSHPNIVQCLGIHTSPENDQYLVTEFCSLGSLDRFITPQKDTLKATDLLRMAKQAAAGMLHLEEKHVVHRDLALRNLLVKQGDGEKFTVKIADFGLARQLGTESDVYREDDATIPIKWSAPETLRTFEWSVKSDVFSFGVVLWELWSAPWMPWSTHSNKEAYDMVLDGKRMDPPKDAPEEVAKLMMDMWAPNPADRPTFKQVVTTLQEILDVQRIIDYPDEIDVVVKPDEPMGGQHYEQLALDIYAKTPKALSASSSHPLPKRSGSEIAYSDAGVLLPEMESTSDTAARKRDSRTAERQAQADRQTQQQVNSRWAAARKSVMSQSQRKLRQGAWADMKIKMINELTNYGSLIAIDLMQEKQRAALEAARGEASMEYPKSSPTTSPGPTRVGQPQRVAVPAVAVTPAAPTTFSFPNEDYYASALTLKGGRSPAPKEKEKKKSSAATLSSAAKKERRAKSPDGGAAKVKRERKEKKEKKARAADSTRKQRADSSAAEDVELAAMPSAPAAAAPATSPTAVSAEAAPAPSRRPAMLLDGSSAPTTTDSDDAFKRGVLRSDSRLIADDYSSSETDSGSASSGSMSSHE